MEWSRREVIAGAAATVGAAIVSSRRPRRRRRGPERLRPANEPFGYCLNTSTIRGNNLESSGVVDAASKAGFHAIEPWITEIDRLHVEGRHAQGSRQADSRRRADGRGCHRLQFVSR